MLPMISASANAKKRHMAMATGFFFAMALLFSCGRRPLGFVNSWLLAMTGELKVGEGESGGGSGQPFASGGASAARTGQTPAPPKKVSLKDHLPKTSPVHIVMLDRLPPRQDDPRLIKAPPLRHYYGEEWPDEQTDLWLATDGMILYFRFFCHDANPQDLAIVDSQGGGTSPWSDDGIEVFLMKDAKAPYYCQYGVSAGGSLVPLYLEVTDQLGSGKNLGWPANLRMPYAKTSITANGYWVELEVFLDNIGIDRLAPGDELLCQVVRNYRKSGSGRIYVHLFPVQIYGDGGSSSNHHRGAFQPVKVIGPR